MGTEGLAPDLACFRVSAQVPEYLAQVVGNHGTAAKRCMGLLQVFERPLLSALEVAEPAHAVQNPGIVWRKAECLAEIFRSFFHLFVVFQKAVAKEIVGLRVRGLQPDGFLQGCFHGVLVSQVLRKDTFFIPELPIPGKPPYAGIQRFERRMGFPGFLKQPGLEERDSGIFRMAGNQSCQKVQNLFLLSEVKPAGQGLQSCPDGIGPFGYLAEPS